MSLGGEGGDYFEVNIKGFGVVGSLGLLDLMQLHTPETMF